MIAFDIDDVLADFGTPFKVICNRRFGKPALDVMPCDWNWSNFDLTDSQKDETWAEIIETYNFWQGLRVQEGVDPRLVRRVTMRHPTVFPTARAIVKGEPVATQSARWLQRHFEIEFPTVIVSNDKGPLAKILKYDYFIDDRPKNVIEVKEARPECKVFIKDASHNVGLSHPDIPRISGANEFCNIILEG